MTKWPRVHVAAALAIALLLVVLATSARPPRPAPRLRAAYAAVNGLRIRYVRAGRGPTILLLHGYGESLVAWRGVFERLAEHADVIAMDLPGFGLSSKPPAGYATDAIAATVGHVLAALGVARATVAGHSLGGAVAAALAVTDSGVVSGLVLLDAAVVGAPAGLPDAGRDDDAVRAARRAIAEYEAMRTRFTAPHDPHWLAEDDSAAAYLPADDPAYRTALAAILREFDFRWLTPDRAARMAMPVLVLWGEYDPVFTLQSGRDLAAALPHARLEVIPRTWHRPHEERPDAVADAILAFLGIGSGQTPHSP